jgi:hypothetical protein
MHGPDVIRQSTIGLDNNVLRDMIIHIYLDIYL